MSNCRGPVAARLWVHIAPGLDVRGDVGDVDVHAPTVWRRHDRDGVVVVVACGCGRWFVREGLSVDAPGGASPRQPLAQKITPAIPATSVKPITLATIVDAAFEEAGAGAGACGRFAGGREFIGGRGRCGSCRGRSAEKLPIAEEGASSRSISDALFGLPTWSFIINPILCNSFPPALAASEASNHCGRPQLSTASLKGPCQSCHAP